MFEKLLQEAVRKAERTGLTGPEKKEWAKKWLLSNVENLDHQLGQWMDFAIVDWLQDWAIGLAVEWAWGQMVSMVKSA